jgi:hypothetical protein
MPMRICALLRLLLSFGLLLSPALARAAEPLAPPRPALQGAAARPGPDGALLAAVMARLAAVPQRRASFAEKKTLAALSLPLRSIGKLSYRRPDRFRKVTDWPDAEVLSVQGQHLSLATGGVTRRIDMASQPVIGALVEAILGTLSGDLPGLRRWYHVTATGTPAKWRMTLRPRTAALAKFVRHVTVSGAGAEVTRLVSVEADGDTDVMTITPST